MEKERIQATPDNVVKGAALVKKDNEERFIIKDILVYPNTMFFISPDNKALHCNLENYYIEFPESEQATKEVSITSVLNGIDKLLAYKEKKYGKASSENRIKAFAGKCKFGETLDNKLNRVANGEELLKNDVVDIAGYLILTLREKGWDDFSEFMD